ncbi:MAG: 2-methylcitrate dehydratase [Gammaproteobacteria bacterium]|jgi:2-methylcitrate dehydratase
MNETTRLKTSRGEFDGVISDIVDYVFDYDPTSSIEAMETARHCWLDTIGCGLYALSFTECTKLLGPIVPGASMPGGARVPGTPYELDPVRAAWNIGAMIRWLDYNDTWLAAEWGHPSDNLAAILAAADYRSRLALRRGRPSMTLRDVAVAMIKAHEIQGIIALENSFNRVGLDHVMLVRIASTAVTAPILGCTREETRNAVSHAWLDGSALRAYRHAPNTGSRKSWAAGDASARGVFLALLAHRGEMGYPSAVTTPTWGFQDVLFNGQELKIGRSYGSYVMENVLFKIAYPAEFHAQTAVEASLALHTIVAPRLADVARVEIHTQESADRIINKAGPLNNPADRDHCIQYIVAVALLFGRLTAEDYENDVASDPRVDALREKMTCIEDERFTREYIESDKRAIGNSVQVFFNDGSATEKVLVDYPVGHRRRRDEGIPLLMEKFERYLRARIARKNADRLLQICSSQSDFESCSVDDAMTLLCT